MNKQINNIPTESDSVEASKLLHDPQIDIGILLELGSIGAGHAATALSDILHLPISIEVPKIHNIQAHLIPKFLGKQDMPTMAVYMQLREKYGCDIVLAIELSEAKKIAAMMTFAASISELDQAMEISAIHELANILIGSFLSAISDFVGLSLFPTAPQSTVDAFDAIIDFFLIRQAMFSENALVFETRFKREDEDASCMLMIFLSEELKDVLAQKSLEVLKNDALALY
jgi:chemotaxis protein CheC